MQRRHGSLRRRSADHASSADQIDFVGDRKHHGSAREAELSFPNLHSRMSTMKIPADMRLCLGSLMRVLVCPLALCAYAQEDKVEDQSNLAPVNTAHVLPALRMQIDQAEQQARARPRDPQATGTLAMTLHAYQQYDPAARAYTRAHLLDSRNFDWLYLLGAVEMELGAFDAAVKSFQSALNLRAGDLATNLKMAQSLAAGPDWNAAGAL